MEPAKAGTPNAAAAPAVARMDTGTLLFRDRDKDWAVRGEGRAIVGHSASASCRGAKKAEPAKAGTTNILFSMALHLQSPCAGSPIGGPVVWIEDVT